MPNNSTHRREVKATAKYARMGMTAEQRSTRQQAIQREADKVYTVEVKTGVFARVNRAQRRGR